MARNKHRRPSVEADINITNLVDVTLVLLIIFIIVSPFLEQAINVKLPNARGKKPMKDPVVVVIDSHGVIQVDNKTTDMEMLQQELMTALGPESATRPVHVRSDESVPYGDFAKVMSLIQEAGIQNISMITKPG